MNKIKLPSMAEYVKLTERKRLKLFITETKLLGYDKNLKFANLLSQQPNVGMFVPAVFEDGEWKVLTEPIEYDCFIKGIGGHIDVTFQEYKQYQTALDNVIFDGFEYYAQVKYWQNGHIRFDEEFLENKTIEDLIPYSLTLTPKFAKELGLI